VLCRLFDGSQEGFRTSYVPENLEYMILMIDKQCATDVCNASRAHRIETLMQ